MPEETWRLLHALAVEYVGRTLGAVLILIVGWALLRFLVGPLSRMVVRTRVDPSVASFLVNSARAVLIVVILLGVLQQLGVQTTSLLALLGAAGLAVALSLQSSLANFASGLLVLSFRLVRVGDWVEVGEFRGQVTQMLPFHIVLVTADNQQITVPNTLLTTGGVRNNSVLAVRRAQWTLPLTPKDDLARAKVAVRTTLLADPRILADPAPGFFVQDWAPDKRTLVVTAWTATPHSAGVQQELLEPLGASLEKSRPEGTSP